MSLSNMIKRGKTEKLDVTHPKLYHGRFNYKLVCMCYELTAEKNDNRENYIEETLKHITDCIL